MKRALSLLLVLCMLCGMLASVAVAEETENTGATITVGSVDAAPGEKVEVPVKLTNNPGFAGFTFDVEFDKEALTLKEIKSDLPKITGLDEIENFTADVTTKTETYFNAENVTGNQTLMTLVFDVNAAATAGSYNVSVKLHDDQPTNFCNAEAAAVPVTFVAGGVNVTNGEETPENAPTIEVDSGKGRPGEQVKLLVSVSNNPGLTGLTLKLEYDKSVLALRDVKKGNLDLTMTKSANYEVDPYKLIFDAEETAEGDGTLAELTFEILEGTKEDVKSDVKVICESAYDGNIKPLAFTIVNGYVDVVHYIDGDANGSGTVDTADIVAIRRYLAGGYGIEINEDAADVNYTGTVDTADVVLIRRVLAGGYGIEFGPQSIARPVSVTSSIEDSILSDNDMTITVDNKTGSVGEQVDVYISIANNSGLVGMTLTVGWDKDILELKGVTKGNLGLTMTKPANFNVVPYNLIYDSEETVVGDGTLAKLTFEICENAQQGLNSTITATCVSAYDGDINPVTPTIINGSVTVVVDPVPATSISLNKSALTLTAGESETLTATVTPTDSTDTVTWSSSNESVATVDQTGKVTAVKKGTAKITATAGTVSATCDVTVNCAHTNYEEHSAEPSTCTIQGHGAYKYCKDCNTVFEGNDAKLPLDPNNHVETTVHAAETGTCVQPGHAEYTTCDACHSVISGSDAPVKGPHGNYVEKVEEKYLKTAADCENPAVYYKSCMLCGEKHETDTFENGNSLGHDWKDATCTEPKTCNRCGKTEGEKLGHDYAEEWSKGANTHWHECSRCHDKKDEAAHDFGNGDICTICSYERDHVHRTTLVPAKDATCTESGNKPYYTCSGCEDWFEDANGTKKIADKSSVNLPALNHDWKEATCTEPKTCKRCEETEGDKLGHLMTEHEAKAATCTEPGNIHYYSCGRCGKYFSDEAGNNEITKIEDGKALGHDYQKTAEDDDKITYTCSRCEDTYTEDKVKLPVLPGKLEFPGNQFTDVDKSDWFYFDVKYVSDRGIMDGTGNGEFSPYADLNRAMIVTILYRMEGKPAVSTANTFTDVPSGQWYSEAIEWAASKGIVLGYGNGTYGPFDAVTREQLAAILYRYATLKGYDVKGDFKLDADASYSAWSKANVEWAANKGILVDGLSVNATKTANRAEVARSIRSFLTRVAK